MSTEDRLDSLERDMAVLTERFDAAEKRQEERHGEQCVRMERLLSSIDSRAQADQQARDSALVYRRQREQREDEERAEMRRWLRSLVLGIVTALLSGGAAVSYSAMP